MKIIITFMCLFLVACGSDSPSHSHTESGALGTDEGQSQDNGNSQTDSDQDQDQDNSNGQQEQEEVPEETVTAPQVELPSVTIQSNTVEYINGINIFKIIISGTCSEEGLTVYVDIAEIASQETICLNGSWIVGFNMENLDLLGDVVLISANHLNEQGRLAVPAIVTVVTSFFLRLLLPLLP